MSTDVQVEQLTGRDPEAVAGYAMDPANDTSWIGALTEVELLTDGPVGRGSQVKRIAKFMGKRIEYVNEIVARRAGGVASSDAHKDVSRNTPRTDP